MNYPEALAEDPLFRAAVREGATVPYLMDTFPGRGGRTTYVTARERARNLISADRGGSANVEISGFTESVEVERAVFVNDLHVPFQDERAVNTALEFIDHWRPHHLFLVGDILDCAQVSRYDQDPKRLLDFQKDLDQGKIILAAFRQAVGPEANILYFEGNHETRLWRYLMRHPEIASLEALKFPNLLDLASRNIQWVPADQNYFFHDFLITHGTQVRKHACYSAKAEFEKAGVSGLSGHTHRVGSYRKHNLAGDFIWFENGCLCDLHPSYVLNPDWQHCLAIGQFVRDDNRFQVDQLQMPKGKLLYDGRLFRG